jgi:hypothetical protein
MNRSAAVSLSVPERAAILHVGGLIVSSRNRHKAE